VPSVPLPGYRTFRLGPSAVTCPRWLAEHRADLVHLASPFVLGARGAAAAGRLGLPVVAVYQTDVPGYVRAYHGSRLAEAAAWAWLRQIHNAADRTLAPSTASADRLRAHAIKDIRAFTARAGQLGAAQALRFLQDVDESNTRRRTRVVSLACDLFGGSVAGRTVGVLGAAFKPDSDDIRDSPALAVAAALRKLGAKVSVFDPAAMDRARQAHPELSYEGSVQGAARDADLVLLLTEWPEICDTDPEVLGKTLDYRRPQLAGPAAVAGRRVAVPGAGPRLSRLPGPAVRSVRSPAGPGQCTSWRATRAIPWPHEAISRPGRYAVPDLLWSTMGVAMYRSRPAGSMKYTAEVCTTSASGLGARTSML
jgi:hypothetical protein